MSILELKNFPLVNIVLCNLVHFDTGLQTFIFILFYFFKLVTQ